MDVLIKRVLNNIYGAMNQLSEINKAHIGIGNFRLVPTHRHVCRS